MSAPFLVTGATGKTGRLVVDALEVRGTPGKTWVRAGVRRPQGHRDVALDFRDPATWDKALDGIRAIFLMRSPA